MVTSLWHRYIFCHLRSPGLLKGPKHGGANIKVVEMMQDLRSEVKDVTDRDEVESHLEETASQRGI